MIVAAAIMLIPINAFAGIPKEIIDEINAERRATIKAEKAYLEEKGIKESLIDKAIEIDKIEILMGDEIAEKWFHIKVHGNKDCFESMPFELQKAYFKTEAMKSLWQNICRKAKARGERW